MVAVTSRLCTRRPLRKCMQKLILRLRSQITLASKTQNKIIANKKNYFLILIFFNNFFITIIIILDTK
jgi:hypothetical protein